ncbi:MAG: thioredoxin family protein [Novosphingobium sp.]|uniref:thioredoxin family protein n=1 Tax=Novosphingobium sp. TaxID=1874826 RepID=UPI003C79DF05
MMRLLRTALAIALAVPMLGSAEPVPAADPPPAAEKPVERKFYIETLDDKALLQAELAKAKAAGKLAVIVFGADWCHDSRSLAKVLTSPAFTTEFGARFAVIFIDVGVPQAGLGRNLDLVKHYGIKQMKNTPALFVVSPKDKRLNSVDDARSWKNADSRGEAAILKWFRDFKPN